MKQSQIVIQGIRWSGQFFISFFDVSQTVQLQLKFNYFQVMNLLILLIHLTIKVREFIWIIKLIGRYRISWRINPRVIRENTRTGYILKNTVWNTHYKEIYIQTFRVSCSKKFIQTCLQETHQEVVLNKKLNGSWIDDSINFNLTTLKDDIRFRMLSNEGEYTVK